MSTNLSAAFDVDPIKLFGDYMKVTGVPTLSDERGTDPNLAGKKLGVVNGSSWVSLWSTYFGKMLLPGVKIINAGNEAVQLNFMQAHEAGEDCPPTKNIELFANYAKDLFDLVKVDAILISCSTMNRAFKDVSSRMEAYDVPVIQIDEAMMEEAVKNGGNILVIATHGPTVQSTQSLLKETAEKLGKPVSFTGATVEEAFHLLGAGRIQEHNEAIASVIRQSQNRQKIDIVVLAQLSMSVFAFSYPDPVATFGVPVLTSGETGFRKAGEVLRNKKPGLGRAK